MKYFGGIEGGATHSRLVICQEDGECVAITSGLGTNHWMVGIAECARRIADMVERCKEEIGISQETKLTSLGLSLSGCEQDVTNQELEMELRNTFPDIAEHYIVCSDTIGSVFTASPIGGLVVISGTGSNALLRNPDGTTFTCGGWGHLLGDEGGAWYISYRSIKICFDHMDNLIKCPYPIECVWNLIQEHFNVKTRLDLLPFCYAKFDKSFFASLCKDLAQAAQDGDKLAQSLFDEAGKDIAKSIIALLPNVHNELVKSGDLKVVCVGSVWKSWKLLCDGFTNEIEKASLLFGLQLITITKSMGYGACYLGADSINYNLPRNYADNFEILHHFEAKNTNTVINGSS